MWEENPAEIKTAAALCSASASGEPLAPTSSKKFKLSMLPPPSKSDISFLSFPTVEFCCAIQSLAMVKSKLLSALDRYKGRDIKLEKQRKAEKEARKRKRARKGEEGNSDEDEEVGGVAPNGPKEEKRNGAKGKKGGKVNEMEKGAEDEAQWETDEDESDEDEDDSEAGVVQIQIYTDHSIWLIIEYLDRYITSQ